MAVFIYLPAYGDEGILKAHRGAPLNGNILFEGRLDHLEEMRLCNQGTFVLKDCQDNLKIRVMELNNGPDLDALTGQYVRIKGVDVGDQCVVVAASEVEVLSDACIRFLQKRTKSREGVLQLTADGGFELRDCSNNSLFRVTPGPTSPNLVALLTEYIQVKGRIKEDGLFEVRSVILKPNFCRN
jgi:hypothetical protein